MKCVDCDREITQILASHTYTIKYDEEQGKWVKEVGVVHYICGGCINELDTRDIEDILRQVDEL